MNPQVISINDAARALQRDRATLYRMMTKGELKYVEYGGRRSIPVAEIMRLTSVPPP